MRRILPVIFLISMILAMSSCRYLKQRLNLGEYSLKSAIEWAKRDSTRIADSLKKVMAEKKVTKRILPDSVKKVIADKKVFERTLTDSLMSLEDNDPAAGNPGKGFYIICGSFGNHANAVKEAGKYSNEGFTTTIIKVSGANGSPLELVSIKAFSNYNEALEFLKGFKGSFDPAAWIYSVK
jgi:hypothetical protein